MTTYRVVHRTSYEYGATMTDGYSVACLAPRDTEWQTVRRAEIDVDPDVPEIDRFLDAFGDWPGELSIVSVADAPQAADARRVVTTPTVIVTIDGRDTSVVGRPDRSSYPRLRRSLRDVEPESSVG